MPEHLDAYEIIKDKLPYQESLVDRLNNEKEGLLQQQIVLERELGRVSLEVNGLSSLVNLESDLIEIEKNTLSLSNFIIAREMRLPFEDYGIPRDRNIVKDRKYQLTLLGQARAKARDYARLDSFLSHSDTPEPFIRHDNFSVGNDLSSPRFGRVFVGWSKPRVGVGIGKLSVREKSTDIPELTHNFTDKDINTAYSAYAEIVEEERWDITELLLKPMIVNLSLLTGDVPIAIPTEKSSRRVMPIEPGKTSGFVVGMDQCKEQIDFFKSFRKRNDIIEQIEDFIKNPVSQETLIKRYES